MKTQQATTPVWPWPFYLTVAIAGWYGASILVRLSQQGESWAVLGAIVAAIIGTRFINRTLDARSFQKKLRKASHAFRKVGKAQGRARLATSDDTAREGLHAAGGLFLGALNGHDLYHNAEGSAFIFAPPGAGKTVCSVLPQLLMRHADAHGRDVSMLVLDLTGELYAVSERAMRELGYETIAIAPWATQMSRELGISIRDAGFNPILMRTGEVKDQCEQLARFLLPIPPGANSSSEYFLDFGQSILTWGLMVLARQNDPSVMTLPALRRLLMSSPETLDKLIAEMSQCEEYGGAIAQYANKLYSTKLDAPEEWSGAINSATKSLRIYSDDSALGNHVSATSGFDFRTIKSGKKPKCVYLMIAPELVGSHGNWLNLTLSVAIEQMGSDRTNKRVMCLLDEFANAGAISNLLRALGLYRKQGIQFAFYAQAISQLKRLYGPEGLADMLAMCDVIQAFGVRDPETLKLLSDLAGQTTVKEVSGSFKVDMSRPVQSDYSASASHQSQPLLRGEDIRTLPADKQIVFYKNLHPILADKVSYLTRRVWRKRADPNPYYRKQ